MKILHVPRRYTPTDWGGTESVVEAYACGTVARGHEAEIHCPAALSAPGEDLHQGIRVRRYPYFYPYLGLDQDARLRLDRVGGNLFSFSMRSALRRTEPYVVSIHGGVFDAPNAEQERLTSRTRGTLEWGKALGMWVGSRRVLRDADAVLCVGRREYERASEALPETRVLHLPNGVDAQRFHSGNGMRFRSAHGIPEDAFVVLCVSRIDPQKNQMALLEGLHRWRRRLDGVASPHLVLLGHVTEAAYESSLEAEIERCGLSDAVTMIPGVDSSSPELVDAYHAADVFALPSLHEPFGIVALEAAAAGLRIVAHRVGGLPSMIEHDKTGFLVDPGDAWNLDNAIDALALNPELRARMGAEGRSHVLASYTWTGILERLLALYEEVREAASRRAA
jgi:glycosyltransferase involved in cell wall biosynthesis